MVRASAAVNNAFLDLTDFVRPVLAPFLVSRGLVLGMAVILQRLIDTGIIPPHRFIGDAPLATLSATFDANWYAGIAAHGYSTSPDLTQPQNYHFFPLYPLLMRLLGDFSGLQRVIGGYGVAGVLLSHAFFLVALALLYKLSVRVWNDERLATRTTWLIAALPWAYVFSMAYSESLFLLLSVGAILVAYNLSERPSPVPALLAGLLAALAALTRAQGLVVVIPVVWLLAVTPRWLDIASRIRYAALCALPAFAAVGMFVLAIGLKIGNITAVLETGRGWGRGWIYDLPLLVTLPPSDPYWKIALLSTLTLVLWIGLTVLLLIWFIHLYRNRVSEADTAPRWPAAWAFAAYAGAYLVFTLSAIPAIEGWGRYMLVVFPCAWTIASLIGGEAWFLRLVIVSLSLQVILFAAALIAQVTP